MPGAFGGFRPGRGGSGYRLDWNGAEVMATMIEASRRGIDDISKASYELAREHGPDRLWENETGQTQEAVFWRRAVFEVQYGTEGPHVWGEWGVEDRPRFRPNGTLSDVSTSDVAMFLEFGTTHQDPKPFLYPTFNATRGLLSGAIRAHYVALAGTLRGDRVRDSSGRFISTASLFG